MPKSEFNFTKAKIDVLPLPAQGKRAEHHDANTPGLILRVTSTGKKTFAVYRWVDGTASRVTLGSYPAMTIEQARRKAAEVNGEIAKGENPNARKKHLRAEDTFGTLFEKYLAQHAKLHKKSWKMDEDQYRLHLQHWKNKRISTIQKADVRDLHKKVKLQVERRAMEKAEAKRKTHAGEASATKALESQERSPVTGGTYAANRVLALIRAVFNWAINNELLTRDNPAQGIKMFREQSRDRRLYQHELPAFFQAVAEESNQAIRDYVLMSLMTGARRSNVLAMRWDQISFERGIWTIPETKNGTSQEVPLTETALEILRQRRVEVEGPFVFPGPGKKGHLAEPKKGWARILDRSGLTDLRLHDLRRTLGSWQVDTGATLAVVGRTLNHKSQATTAIYARLSTDPVRESMEKATAAMLAAGGLSGADQ